MPDRTASFWDRRWSAGCRAWRASAAGELRTLAFVVIVVALLVLFRQTVIAGLSEDPDAREFLATFHDDFWQHLFIALTMLVLIQPVRRLGPQEGWRRITVLAVAVLVASAAAAAARLLFLYADGYSAEELTTNVAGMYLRFAIPAGLLVAVGEFYRAEVRGLEAMRAADADRAALEQQTLQARLRVLEAQIEPHFLFNTLATLRRLYETDAELGEAMLERLLRYFEVALPSMRSAQSTLKREAELLESYLELQKVRMGRRLGFAIDIAPALHAVEVPPMMLLTLVENSIKHGLAPQRDGGRVDVAARVEGDDLLLEVADTGRGFGGDTAGGGTGLANIRARLAAMFGARAEFTLAQRQPIGLLATLRIPLAATPVAA